MRRPEPIATLEAFGADAVLVDGPDLAARVAAAVGDGPIKRGIDAIAGEATRRLANCLADNGTLVNYGLLSGKPCEIDAADVVFRNIALRGFWYSRWFLTAEPAAVRSLFLRLVDMLKTGQLRVPLEAAYPIGRLGEALAHAERSATGKIVLQWPL